MDRWSARSRGADHRPPGARVRYRPCVCVCLGSKSEVQTVDESNDLVRTVLYISKISQAPARISALTSHWMDAHACAHGVTRGLVLS